MGDEDRIRDRLRRAADERAARAPARGAVPAFARAWRGRRWIVGLAPVAATAVLAAVLVQARGPIAQGPGTFLGSGSPEQTIPEPDTEPTDEMTPSGRPTETEDPSPRPTYRTSPTPTPSKEPPVVGGSECRRLARADAPKGIEVSLDVSYAGEIETTSEVVEFTVRMRNTGLAPVPNQHSSQEWDVYVLDDQGDFWVWSHERAFTQPLISDTYEPGEERTGEATWDRHPNCAGAIAGRAASGKYLAFGVWVTFDEKAGERAWYSEPVPVAIR